MKTQYKIKQNLTLKCLFALAVMITGCSTDLEEDPGKVQLDPASLSTDAELDALTTGMYRTLADGARWTDFYMAGFGGDDITTFSAGNKAGFRSSDWRRQTSTSERIGRAYSTPYKVIAIANTAIDNRTNIEGDTDKVNRLIGEAYFMRAFSYIWLTRTYGRVPLQLLSNSNEPLERATFVEIYQQIESDLVEAETLLPDVYPGIEAIGVRPNKGSAKAFLARLYLNWAGFPINDNSKYAQAAAKAKEVIDGPYGFALTDDFRGMWTETGRFAHNEGVFTLVGCKEGCNRGNRTTGRLGLPGDAGGWNETFGEIAFFEEHEATAMAEGTMQRFNDTYVLEVIPRGQNPDGADWRNFSNEPHPLLRKVVGADLQNETVYNTTDNDLNRYFMRYAEVLLTYAEASGRSGSATAEAWEALNKVRRRAAGLPIDTPDAGIDHTSGDLGELAYQERKWEFAGEYERWHDMVRMDRVVEALQNRSVEERADVVNQTVPATSGDALYFTPIPQSEIDRAPQLAN